MTAMLIVNALVVTLSVLATWRGGWLRFGYSPVAALVALVLADQVAIIAA